MPALKLQQNLRQNLEMNMNAKSTGLGLMLPVVLNPAVAAVIGIGLVGLGIYRLLDDEDEVCASEASDESSIGELVECSDTAELAAGHENSDCLASADAVSLDKSPADVPANAALGQQDADREADKQKIIREAMSELGKRSAAARARKKAEASLCKMD
jgi:hypothetical protein